MEEKDDMTCGREGDGHPFTQLDLQDKFITPIMILRTYTPFLEIPDFKEIECFGNNLLFQE